jgi:hypothetical protein
MGLKQGAIGNTHGEHIGNLLEQKKNEKNLPLSPPPPPPPKTQNKPMGNTLRTYWNQKKNEKNLPLPPPFPPPPKI